MEEKYLQKWNHYKIIQWATFINRENGISVYINIYWGQKGIDSSDWDPGEMQSK